MTQTKGSESRDEKEENGRPKPKELKGEVQRGDRAVISSFSLSWSPGRSEMKNRTWGHGGRLPTPRAAVLQPDSHTSPNTNNLPKPPFI